MLLPNDERNECCGRIYGNSTPKRFGSLEMIEVLPNTNIQKVCVTYIDVARVE